ncbi:recombinase family protein [Gordonia sp. 852002-50395_SCH5434458]|uniref:recombinase family protein n=1 Tax=Gordonia sp. 852002-50395_SCH5434458 TaxID=1834090 RepID=UPI0007EA46D9|nr:recombinase family protein [Gordonia sp. 852002-50395_SCH5434458]OBC02699.1 DNA resolvase [Gordonia sp. 852002-50395_SCH5434458]
MKIGYARCSTYGQDLTAQIDALTVRVVEENQIHTDLGCPSDELVVTKLDRLARSVSDARDIVEGLTDKGVKLRIGGSLHDPDDSTGRLLLNARAMVAEFEVDLVRACTREGVAVANAKGRLRGKKKLPTNQECRLVQFFQSGEHTVGERAEDFGVSRATDYRADDRSAGIS